MPPHASESLRDFLGPGAVPTALMAAVSAVGGLGIPVAVRLARVLAGAREDRRSPADGILVLGRSLGPGDVPTAVFRARLDHGLALLRAGLAPRIVVTGGLTSRAAISEAEAGRRYLLERGAPPDAVLCEDRSRHTLENLQNTRSLGGRSGWRRWIAVSDPLHLARVTTYARGVALEVVPSPATGCPPRPGTFAWWFRALREATLLHWYHLGAFYSRLTRSEHLLSRIR